MEIEISKVGISRAVLSGAPKKVGGGGGGYGRVYQHAYRTSLSPEQAFLKSAEQATGVVTR